MQCDLIYSFLDSKTIKQQYKENELVEYCAG
jgi:hypothetical protein